MLRLLYQLNFYSSIFSAMFVTYHPMFPLQSNNPPVSKDTLKAYFEYFDLAYLSKLIEYY